MQVVDHIRAQRFGSTYGELAERFCVDARTIRRDLDALERAGVALSRTTDDDRKVRVRMASGSPPHLRLTPRECFVLLAARGLFQPFAGSAFGRDMESVFDKVAGLASRGRRADLDDLKDRFRYVPDGGVKRYRDETGALDVLMQAVIQQETVAFSYQAIGRRAKAGTLEPYAIVVFRMGLYVVGRRRYRDGAWATRVFALERFRRLEPRRQTFEVPDDFELEQYFLGAFGLHSGGPEQAVVVDFESPAASYVAARTYQADQKAEVLKGGRLRLRFTVTDLTEVVPWVLQWGGSARVVEPPELRAEVVRRLDEARAKYPASRPRRRRAASRRTSRSDHA